MSQHVRLRLTTLIAFFLLLAVVGAARNDAVYSRDLGKGFTQVGDGRAAAKGNHVKTPQREDNASMLYKSLFFLISFLAIYFIPAIAAHERKHENSTAILITNLLLGWTLIGWVVALIWACAEVQTAPHRPRKV
jgi:hypothetical protein